MNEKKLYKIIKKAFLDIKNEDMVIKESLNSYNDMLFTESDEDIKKRSRNLIFRLLTLRDQLHININDKTISISSELYKLKNTKLGIGKTQNYDEYFSLEIIDKVGYILSYSDKRFAFKDEFLYEETIVQINIIFKKVNHQNFEEIYQTIMKESGLARESNLDDLLS